MRKHFSKFLVCFIFLHSSYFVNAQRIIQSFDKAWRFFKGDENGADQLSFNDATWRKLDVPHDWSIEGPYDKNNPTKSGGGYLPSGVGWYRKTFSLDDTYANKLYNISIFLYTHLDIYTDTHIRQRTIDLRIIIDS